VVANTPPERIAILVIHGVGQQKPYETLDQFARGLLKSYDLQNLPNDQASTWTILSQLDLAKDPEHAQQDWIRASHRLQPSTPLPFAGADNQGSLIENITLFEYYWAPITQDKVTYSNSLLFLIQAGFKPFKYLALNLDILIATSNRAHLVKIFVKELIRQTFLLLPLLLGLTGLLAWLTSQSPAQILATTRSLPTDTLVLLVFLAIRYLYIFATVTALVSSLKARPAKRLARLSKDKTPSFMVRLRSMVTPARPEPYANWQSSLGWKGALSFALLVHIFVWPWAVPYILNCLAHVERRIASWHQTLSLFGKWATVLEVAYAKTMSHPGEGAWAHLQRFLYFKPHLDHYSYF